MKIMLPNCTRNKIVQYNAMLLDRLVARNSLILMNFQDFKFLESKTAHAHSFYKKPFYLFYFSTNLLRSLFHSVSVLKGLATFTLRILYGMFRSLSSLIILASFIIVTLSSNCRRCVSPICIVDYCNDNKPNLATH